MGESQDGGPALNEHGAPVTEHRIFRWNELDTTRWDDDQIEAQMLTGEHMHMIRATLSTAVRPSATSRRSSSTSTRRQASGFSTHSRKAGVSRGTGFSLLGDSTAYRHPVGGILES